ncbi:NAD(P)-binding domain-containing protein [Kibdelosporangium lantanae]
MEPDPGKPVPEGATLAPSVRAAVAASPLVVVCVSDHAAIPTLLDPLDLDGRTVVNLSSGTSRAARDAPYLAGAIMAAPAEIGDALVVYSGPRTAFDRYADTLRSLGTATYLGEDPGLVALHEAAVLALMWSVLNGFLHGAAILRSGGVPATAFTEMARQGIGTTTSWLAGYAEQIDAGEYPADDSSINTHLAAMDNLVRESESAGVSTELPALVRAVAERAVARGLGGAGYAAVVEVLRTGSGT